MLFAVCSRNEGRVVEACWLYLMTWPFNDLVATIMKAFLLFPFAFDAFSCIQSTFAFFAFYSVSHLKASLESFAPLFGQKINTNKNVTEKKHDQEC